MCSKNIQKDLKLIKVIKTHSRSLKLINVFKTTKKGLKSIKVFKTTKRVKGTMSRQSTVQS